MPQPRRRIPESFKREAVNQVLPGTPRRHVSLSLATFLAVEASNRKSPHRRYEPDIWPRPDRYLNVNVRAYPNVNV